MVYVCVFDSTSCITGIFAEDQYPCRNTVMIFRPHMLYAQSRHIVRDALPSELILCIYNCDYLLAEAHILQGKWVEFML